MEAVRTIRDSIFNGVPPSLKGSSVRYRDRSKVYVPRARSSEVELTLKFKDANGRIVNLH